MYYCYLSGGLIFEYTAPEALFISFFSIDKRFATCWSFS